MKVIIFLTLFTLSATYTVKWLPNVSLNVKTNFKDGKLPCSKQVVIFPNNLNGPVKIESGTSVGGFILPVNSEFDLAEGTINFGADPKENCEAGNVDFLDKTVSSWAQPDVWSSPRFNEATPDAERVPCYDDDVLFAKNSEFTVFLPERQQYIRSITLDGHKMDTSQFKLYVDSSNSFELNQNQETGVVVGDKECTMKIGCPCQEHMLEIDCAFKFCPTPKCVDPIKPLGHCCEICGGVLAFDIDQSFDLKDFKDLVNTTVESFGSDSLVYHVGRLPKNKVQLVVVDKNEYYGSSVEVVMKISHLMENHWVLGDKIAQISGSPLYKSGMGAKIVISMFFAVVLMMGGIYAYYYKLPEIRYPIGGHTRGILSRFQRRTDSVVSLTRRDSGVPTNSGIGTAFRNPLYDSKRGRVQVTESVLEE